MVATINIITKKNLNEKTIDPEDSEEKYKMNTNTTMRRNVFHIEIESGWLSLWVLQVRSSLLWGYTGEVEDLKAYLEQNGKQCITVSQSLELALSISLHL